MASDRLRLGILGCGAISQSAHVPAALRARRVELVALCDAAADLLDKVANRADVAKRYTRYVDMLADADIDAVLIAAPDPFHVPLAEQALAAGRHVLVEKPLGVSSAECQRLVEAVGRSGLKLQVGSMKRHDPGVAFAHQFIREKLGPLLSVSAVYRDSVFRPDMQAATLDPVLTSDRTARPAQDPKADRARYNLITQGAHLVDNLRYLAGPVSTVTAHVAHHDGQWSWHGLLAFAGGGHGHFELTCKACGDWCERYEVYGQRGSVQVQVPLPFYHRPARARGFEGATGQWTQPLGGRSNAYVNQLEAFAAAVLEDQPPSPDAHEGLAAVQLLEAIERSVVSGGRVVVSQPTEVTA